MPEGWHGAGRREAFDFLGFLWILALGGGILSLGLRRTTVSFWDQSLEPHETRCH
jgi:hypothetical protein